MAGLFGSILHKSAGFEMGSLELWSKIFGSTPSKTGISVTWATALRVTAMFCAARVIAEGVAQASCKLMKHRTGNFGADRQPSHPLYGMLSLKPNSWQTAFEFWETIIIHLVFVGNSYIYVSRGVGDRILELIIMQPQSVAVRRLNDLSMIYTVTGEDGTQKTFTSKEIWHLRGPSWNGWMGMEAIKLAREALGLSLALEAGHADLHNGGLVQPGTYSIEAALNADQKIEQADWVKRHVSGDRKGMPLVLDRGARWFSQALTGVDAQHLETRRFQIEEVSRVTRVMPIMLMQQDGTASYASSEQMFLNHKIHCLDPWTIRLGQSAAVNLLTQKEIDEGYYFEFNMNAFMRSDYKTRQEGLQIQRRNGVINANQWRDIETMNPRDDNGGDQYIVEGNMAVQDGRDLVPVSTLKVSA